MSSKKKNIDNVNKLTTILKPMSRLQLNKFVSNLNKDLKISGAAKMKRNELEAELLNRADMIISMIDKDKNLKLFDSTVKPRPVYMTKEEEKQMYKEVKRLLKKIKQEEDISKKLKMGLEVQKIQEKLQKAVIKEGNETPKKTQSKPLQAQSVVEPKMTNDEKNKILKKIDELFAKAIGETNQSKREKILTEEIPTLQALIK